MNLRLRRKSSRSHQRRSAADITEDTGGTRLGVSNRGNRLGEANAVVVVGLEGASGLSSAELAAASRGLELEANDGVGGAALLNTSDGALLRGGSRGGSGARSGWGSGGGSRAAGAGSIVEGVRAGGLLVEILAERGSVQETSAGAVSVALALRLGLAESSTAGAGGVGGVLRGLVCFRRGLVVANSTAHARSRVAGSGSGGGASSRRRGGGGGGGGVVGAEFAVEEIRAACVGGIVTTFTLAAFLCLYPDYRL